MISLTPSCCNERVKTKSEILGRQLLSDSGIFIVFQSPPLLGLSPVGGHISIHSHVRILS